MLRLLGRLIFAVTVGGVILCALALLLPVYIVLGVYTMIFSDPFGQDEHD